MIELWLFAVARICHEELRACRSLWIHPRRVTAGLAAKITTQCLLGDRQHGNQSLRLAWTTLAGGCRASRNVLGQDRCRQNPLRCARLELGSVHLLNSLFEMTMSSAECRKSSWWPSPVTTRTDTGQKTAASKCEAGGCRNGKADAQGATQSFPARCELNLEVRCLRNTHVVVDLGPFVLRCAARRRSNTYGHAMQGRVIARWGRVMLRHVVCVRHVVEDMQYRRHVGWKICRIKGLQNKRLEESKQVECRRV